MKRKKKRGSNWKRFRGSSRWQWEKRNQLKNPRTQRFQWGLETGTRDAFSDSTRTTWGPWSRSSEKRVNARGGITLKRQYRRKLIIGVRYYQEREQNTGEQWLLFPIEPPSLHLPPPYCYVQCYYSTLSYSVSHFFSFSDGLCALFAFSMLHLNERPSGK